MKTRLMANSDGIDAKIETMCVMAARAYNSLRSELYWWAEVAGDSSQAERHSSELRRARHKAEYETAVACITVFVGDSANVVRDQVEQIANELNKRRM